MSPPEERDLEPELARLLDSERAASDFPEARRDEMYAKIAAVLPDGAGIEGEGPRAPRVHGLGARGVKIVALLAIGGALGALGARAFAPVPAPQVAPPTTNAPSAVPPRSTGEEPKAPSPVAPLAPEPPVTLPSPPAAQASPAAPPPSVAAPTVARAGGSSAVEPDAAPFARSSLAEERALVERGRAAIARGDGLSALEALTEHARGFPSGKLAEERDALIVQALALRGRADDARRKAGEFERTYPTSVFLPRVQETVRALGE